jgi:Na+-transporting NADH:ubiquinone oxidoreductase subunit C
MKEKIMIIVFVLILGGVLTTALVGVNSFTEPKIAKNAEIKLKSSVLEALEIPFELESVEQAFSNNVKTAEENGTTYYIAANGDLALPYEGSGLWGPIKGIIAMNPDLARIAGLTIMQQEETPGLGSRIADAEYLEAFAGKRFAPALNIVSPGTADGENEIDSISGATLSSKAFIDILNAEHARYIGALGGS